MDYSGHDEIEWPRRIADELAWPDCRLRAKNWAGNLDLPRLESPGLHLTDLCGRRGCGDGRVHGHVARGQSRRYWRHYCQPAALASSEDQTTNRLWCHS